MDYKKLSKICDGEVTRLDSSLVSKWNEYCENANDPDDMIYSMDEFDEMMSGQSPYDIARSVWYGDFNPNVDWFWFDGRGNLCAGDYTNDSDCPIDMSALEEEPEELTWEGYAIKDTSDDSIYEDGFDSQDEADARIDEICANHPEWRSDFVVVEPM